MRSSARNKADIAIRKPTYWFRLRVAAVCRHRGHVLLCKKRGNPRWGLPGGQVKENESLPVALDRELVEEVGEVCEVREPLFVLEYFDRVGVRRLHVVSVAFSVRPNRRLISKVMLHKPWTPRSSDISFCWVCVDSVSLARFTLSPPQLPRALRSVASTLSFWTSRKSK